MPQFDFATFECLDHHKVRQTMKDEIKNKNVDVIIKLRNDTPASDIAMQTDMFTFL